MVGLTPHSKTFDLALFFLLGTGVVICYFVEAVEAACIRLGLGFDSFSSFMIDQGNDERPIGTMQWSFIRYLATVPNRQR